MDTIVPLEVLLTLNVHKEIIVHHYLLSHLFVPMELVVLQVHFVQLDIIVQQIMPQQLSVQVEIIAQ